MAIDQIGVPASVPQQFEQIITSSTNWSVPAGVKTVEYMIAGGGSNSFARGGFAKGIYNVQGKTSIPITIGAVSNTTGVRAGTTTFDNSIIATGGIFTGNTNLQNGNLVDLAIHAGGAINNNGTPLSQRTSFSVGTTARFRYFAAFNGRGIAISNDGTAAMTTTNSGATWTAVTSITGSATNLLGVVSEREMLLHHNGTLWLVFSRGGTTYAYSENGTTWVTASFAGGINDMAAMGSGSSRTVILVNDSGHFQSTNITNTAFVNMFGARGDVIFRVGGDSNAVTFTGGTSTYRWSNNSGSSWTNSSYSGISLQSVNRWVKSYNQGGTALGVMFQRGQNSSSFTAVARSGNNDQYFWQSWDSINTSGGGNTASPNGSNGANTTSTTVHIWRPQNFDENEPGAMAAWTVSSNMITRTDVMAYSYINTNDGTLVGTNFNSPHLGGNFIYDVSEYVVGPNSPFRVLFTDSGQSDGFVYRAMGFIGQGISSGNIQSGYTQIPSDATGDFLTNSYGTTNPVDVRYYGGGEDGWGRVSGVMVGLGFGGAGQNGAVRLRWWA